MKLFAQKIWIKIKFKLWNTNISCQRIRDRWMYLVYIKWMNFIFLSEACAHCKQIETGENKLKALCDS
jgi:hypothetical protein